MNDAIRVDALTDDYLFRLSVQVNAELAERKKKVDAKTDVSLAPMKISELPAVQQMEAGGLLISHEVASGEARAARQKFAEEISPTAHMYVHKESVNVPMPCEVCTTATECMAGTKLCADARNFGVSHPVTDGLEPWREAAKTILEGVHGTGLLEELLRRRLRTMLGAQRPDHARRHPHEAYMLMLRAAKHLASARRALAEAGDTVAAQ